MYVVGVDFGTLSARAVVVRVADGQVLGSAVAGYRHGVIERVLPGSDRLLPADWALQDPADWWIALGDSIRRAVAASGVSAGSVVGIGTDFTACTVLPVRADGVPLCQVPGLAGVPHAWPKLWKHHAAQGQADRINEVAHERGEGWIGRYGGRISSEWQFAKALQVLEEAPEVYRRTDRWIEAADWIVWQLCGVETRNACTAGYKGIFQDGRYPSVAYLSALHPDFGDFAETRLGGVPLSALGAPCRPAHCRRGRVDRVAGGDRGCQRQCGRTRHRARGPGARVRAAARHHGYVDLSRDEQRGAGRGARDVRCRRGRHCRRGVRV